MIETPNTLFISAETPVELKNIAQKVQEGTRITAEEGLYLYENAPLSFLGELANFVREKKHGDKTYFNRNFHLEPTNYCVFTCNFCSYSRKLREKENTETWFYSNEEMLDIVKSYDDQPVTEVHIVGGVHPKLSLSVFGDLLSSIREHRPDLHIKAFTPVEYEYMFRKAKVSYTEGLQFLKEKGLQSIPGGGAEIFAEEIRAEICADKCNAEQWLDIHEAAHNLDIPSNATMLYGHIETYEHRIDHMNRLRTLQDKTGGFNTFIPLKFRNKNNDMSHVPETVVVEDLKNYAIARIFMDNFNHVKAYWPMIGRETAQMSLAFGVNDIDGTIDDTTKIYSMAGSEEQTPAMSTKDLVKLIRAVGREPIERNTTYDVVKDYTDHKFEDDKFFKGYIKLPVINN